jgi:hypothetical protein
VKKETYKQYTVLAILAIAVAAARCFWQEGEMIAEILLKFFSFIKIAAQRSL